MTKRPVKPTVPVVANAFCPTGEGGGQKNTCGGKSGGESKPSSWDSSPSHVREKLIQRHGSEEKARKASDALDAHSAELDKHIAAGTSTQFLEAKEKAHKAATSGLKKKKKWGG